MAQIKVPSAQLLRSLRALTVDGSSRSLVRGLSTTSSGLEQAQAEKQGFLAQVNANPETVFIPRLEKKLIKAGKMPIGSRRRRAALASSEQIPFDQLPYQCFQEARKILIADRATKLAQIEQERARIARLQETSANSFTGGEAYKQKRLQSMQKEVEHLKILADINDPNVKRRFEDGKGDMSKPVYRFLADRKWREYRRKVQVQRLAQMKVVPDVIAHLDPIVDTAVRFGTHRPQPGDFVDSKISEQVPSFTIQSFDRGEKLVTIAVIDADVPNLETDSFDTYCHFLASNIPISPTAPTINDGKLTQEQQILLPWTPPTAQKGSPYHRLSVLVFQQKNNIPIDLQIASQKAQREKFSMRGFMTRHMLQPIGGTMFRTKWDDNMAGVMARAGIDGANVELKRTKVEPLPYKRRNPSTFR